MPNSNTYHRKGLSMDILNTLTLKSNRQIKVNFDGGDLSSDAGLLLIKEFAAKIGFSKLIKKKFKTNDKSVRTLFSKKVFRLKRELVIFNSSPSSGISLTSKSIIKNQRYPLLFRFTSLFFIFRHFIVILVMEYFVFLAKSRNFFLLIY